MKSRFVILVVVIAVFAAPFAHGADAVTVSREDWIVGMKNALPVAFCKPGMYFRACFNVTQEECEKTTVSATRICLENLKGKLPASLKQPNDGQSWGTKVGECAGTTYDTTLAKKKINSKKCNDPSAW